MAALEEHVLTCSICMELFKDPKMLPCQHNFCKQCLESFINGERKRSVGRLQNFSCPLCRRKLPMETKDGKPKVFQTNLLLSSFMDVYKEKLNANSTLRAKTFEKQTQTTFFIDSSQLCTVGTQTEETANNVTKNERHSAEAIFLKCLPNIKSQNKMLQLHIIRKICRNTLNSAVTILKKIITDLKPFVNQASKAANLLLIFLCFCVYLWSCIAINVTRLKDNNAANEYGQHIIVQKSNTESSSRQQDTHDNFSQKRNIKKSPQVQTPYENFIGQPLFLLLCITLLVYFLSVLVGPKNPKIRTVKKRRQLRRGRQR